MRSAAFFEGLTRFSVWLLFFSVFSSASGIGAATVFLTLGFIVACRDDLRKIPSMPLFWPIVLLVAALALSTVFAQGQGFGKPLGKLRYFLFYFLLVGFFARHPRTRVLLARAGVGLAWVLGVVAALQFTGVFCPLVYFGFTPVPLAPFENGAFFHARGLLYHHNPFAYTSLLLFFLLFGRAVATAGREQLACFSGILCLVPALALSGSRGSWVALAVALTVVAARLGRGGVRLLFGILSAVAAVAVVLSRALAERFASIHPQANPERLRLWEIAWHLFRDAPLLGTGYHYGFELQRGRYMTDAEKANPFFPTDPHSLYFDLLATTGIIGTLAFLGFAGAALKGYWNALKNEVGADERGALVTGLGCWVAFLVGTAFDSHFFHTQTLAATLFFLAYGQSVIFQIRAGGGSTRTSP